MEFKEEIISAKKCPYCGCKPKYVDSEVIYGRSYGMIYLCSPCNAYVGVYKSNPKEPLGRLADKELREAKKRAHFFFDQLWQKAIKEGRQKSGARSAAYEWLSGYLGTPKEYTHIGMFDVKMCEKVIEVCLPYCESKVYVK